MKLNSKKTLIFLNVAAGMRPALKKYQNEKERNSFLSIYKDINARSQEIDRIIQSAHFSSEELKQIKKEINRWPWKKIRLIFFLIILSALVSSYVYFLSLPRVYKISKETILYSDSSCTQISSDSLISNVDIFSNEGGKFIKAGNNSVKPSGYFNWLTGKSQVYFYKNDYEFTDDKAVFDNKFRDLYDKTTDYDSLTVVDKIGILKLLDTLGSVYSLSANSNKPSLPRQNILHDNCDANSRSMFLILKKSVSNIKSGYYLIIDSKNPNKIKNYPFTCNGIELKSPIEWLMKAKYDIRLLDSGGNVIFYKMAGSTCSFKIFDKSTQ
jgi:hypothetical protein